MQGLFDLSGRVAVITGASSGIGRAMAGALADAGAGVVLVARREAELESVVDEIRKGNGEAEFVAADLSAWEQLPDVANRFRIWIGDRIMSMLVRQDLK